MFLANNMLFPLWEILLRSGKLSPGFPWLNPIKKYSKFKFLLFQLLFVSFNIKNFVHLMKFPPPNGVNTYVQYNCLFQI